MNPTAIRLAVDKALGAVAPEADLSALDTSLPFQDQLDIDSIGFLDFAVGLADETGVEVPERDFPLIATVDGCIAYLTERATPGPPTE